MKKIVFLFWIVAATPLLSQNKSVTISEGLAQGLLDYSAKGAWNANDKYEYTDANGQYYGKSIAIRIHNRSKEDLSIEVPAGLLMMSEDSVVQDMLVTQPMFATLGPRQTKHFLLYAMCSEIHDGVPNTAVNYFVGKMAPKDLVKIAEAIHDMLMQNVAGQAAVWSYTDKASEADVRRYGSTTASLKITAELLKRAGVQTALSSFRESASTPAGPNLDSLRNSIREEIAREEKLAKQAEPVDNSFHLSPTLVYGGAGLLLLLLGTTTALAIHQRKKTDKAA